MTQLIKKFLVTIILFFLPFSIYVQTKSHQLGIYIFDTSKGEPAQGVDITLYKLNSSTLSQWKQIATGKTDVSGRISNFLPSIEDNTSIYMLKFYTEPYFLKQGLKSVYPFAEVIFRTEGKKHYHIPTTMSINGYSAYRGNQHIPYHNL